MRTSGRLREWLGSLAKRDFGIFLVGFAASQLAQTIQVFTIAWLLVRLSIDEGHPERGALYLGLLGLGRFATGAPLGLYAGVMADRLDRRTILIATRSISLMIVGALTVLTFAAQAQPPLVLGLATILFVLLMFDIAAARTLPQILVGPRDLYSAFGVVRSVVQVTGITGPLIAGLLIVAIDVPGAFALAAALSLISMFTMVALRPAPPSAEARSTHSLVLFNEGLGFVRREPTLRGLIVSSAMFSGFGAASMDLLPVVAVESLHVGAQELSWMASSMAVGALTGTIASSTMGRWPHQGRLLLAAAFAMGAALVLFAIQRTLVPAIVVLWLVGTARFIYQGGATNLVQVSAPRALYGRIYSFQFVAVVCGLQLGTFAFGTLATVIGASNAIAVSGVIVLCAAVIALRVPAVRDVQGPGKHREPDEASAPLTALTGDPTDSPAASAGRGPA